MPQLPDNHSSRVHDSARRRWLRVLSRSLVLTAASLVWAALPASAAPSVLASPADPSVNDLATDVGRATAWIVKLSAVAATFFLTYGGARYMTAGSEPSEVERAKAALRAAGIGYALCILAPVFLLVIKSILGVSS